jgi:hypothetical protein
MVVVKTLNQGGLASSASWIADLLDVLDDFLIPQVLLHALAEPVELPLPL